jgi:hypothetical protein
MSAGGLSYSAINSNRRVSLPSVETWGTNMNIIKDPPKSIFTRKKIKVGDTNLINNEIENSNSRTDEAILKFARGVNPMVAVSYQNQGNNGGLSTLQRSQNTQAFLPYRIMKDGDFRPPIMSKEELLPLSRQSRKNTNVYTKPHLIDFSKKGKIYTKDTNQKEVRKKILEISAKPNSSFKLETPLSKPYETKYNVKDNLLISADSGIRTMNITEQNVQTPYNTINDSKIHLYDVNPNINVNKYVFNSTLNTEPYVLDNIHYSVDTNISDNTVYVNNTIMDTERFLQDNINGNISYNTNISSNNSFDHDTNNIIDQKFIKTKDINNIDYFTNISQNIHKQISPDNEILLSRNLPEHNINSNISQNIHKQISPDNEILLSRNLPEYNINSNISQNIHKQVLHENEIKLQRNLPITEIYSNKTNNKYSNISSTDFNLRPKVNAGGFDGRPNNIPLLGENKQFSNLKPSYSLKKNNMNRLISENFQRY